MLKVRLTCHNCEREFTCTVPEIAMGYSGIVETHFSPDSTCRMMLGVMSGYDIKTKEKMTPIIISMTKGQYLAKTSFDRTIQ